MGKGSIDQLHAFGLAVRTLRIKAELSQEDLAHAARVHRTYVGSVERGERNISLKNISAFAAALSCSPSELLRVAERIQLAGGDGQRSAT